MIFYPYYNYYFRKVWSTDSNKNFNNGVFISKHTQHTAYKSGSAEQYFVSDLN